MWSFLIWAKVITLKDFSLCCYNVFQFFGLINFVSAENFLFFEFHLWKLLSISIQLPSKNCTLKWFAKFSKTKSHFFLILAFLDSLGNLFIVHKLKLLISKSVFNYAFSFSIACFFYLNWGNSYWIWILIKFKTSGSNLLQL